MRTRLAVIAALLPVMVLPITGCGAAERSVADQSAVLLNGGGTGLPEFVSGAFPTRGQGWLLGGTPSAVGNSRAEVWRTDTAGVSWRVQWQGPGNAISISATDRLHAWALIGCARSTRSRECPTELITTADGGAEWRRSSRLPPSANSVQFSSTAFGVVTADAVCPGVTAPSRCPGEVLVSDDGGARWSTVLRSGDPLYAAIGPSGRLWAAQVIPGFEDRPGAPRPEVRFLNSADGGRSWRPVGELTGTGLELLGATTTVHLAGGPAGLEWASLFDQGDCAMHGCGTAALYRSSDGGQSWKIADLYGELSDQCGPDGMVFSSAPDGTAWAATGQNGGACQPPFGMLYRHDQTGWRQLPPWQLSGISWLGAIDREVAYAISDGTTVVRTDDGGLHWTQLLPALAPTSQLDGLDQQTALAAGDATDAGAVLRSTDGGRRWRQIAQLPGIITGLDFPSRRDGIALTLGVDRFGRAHWQLWRSRAGGQSWRTEGRPLAGRITSGDISGPWMRVDGHGVLLSVAGAIDWQGAASGGVAPVREWTTDDWGAHWQPGNLLPVGNNTSAYVVGHASFISTAPGRWAGWMIYANASTDWRIEAIINSGRTLTLVPHSATVNNLQLIDPSSGFAWAFQPEPYPTSSVLLLYRTTDAGRHWQRIRILIPTMQIPGPMPQPMVDFANPDQGWLIVGATSWHTSDGGGTWHRG